jgi:hypothetical protein
VSTPAEENFATRAYVDKLRSNVDAKWARKEKEEKAEKAEEEGFQFNLNKALEIAVIASAITFFKLELPPLINTEVTADRLLGKIGITRNSWGVLWRAKDELSETTKAIRRLQDMTTSAHQKINNSNSRIGELEKKVGRINAERNVARQGVRQASNPNLAGSGRIDVQYAYQMANGDEHTLWRRGMSIEPPVLTGIVYDPEKPERADFTDGMPVNVTRMRNYLLCLLAVELATVVLMVPGVMI